jgi:peptidoglycan/xylan/chitin deacetylase (PgdA/CDA1 family)
MLTDEQLRRLADRGVAIGAHTVNHPILAAVDENDARQEISSSRAELQDLLQKDVNAFAYPNGKPGRDYLPEHRDMVEEAGFELAVATHPGVACPESDLFQLPRFTPWDPGPLRFTLRLFAAFRNVDGLINHG